MNGKYDKWDYICLASLIVGFYFLFIHGIWSYGLWDPWEPKYGQAVREMLERRDLITPRFDGNIRWTKPVLIYWAVLVPVLAFGNNEFALRLPSGLVALAGVLVMFHTLRSLHNRRMAMVGACVLGLFPQYCMLARQVTPDIYLTSFLGMCMCFFALARFGKRHHFVYYLLFYASFALAFLAKGLPVGVGPVAFLIFWSVNFNRRHLRRPIIVWRSFLRMFSEYRVLWGIGMFLIIAGPWYAVMFMRHGGEFNEQFFVTQNIGRFNQTVTGHAGAVEFYFRTLAHGLFPWGAFLPLSFLTLFRNGLRRDEETREKWYFVSWFIAVFVVFTASATKFTHYIAPITPCAAVLIAFFWNDYFEQKSRYWIAPMLLLAVLFSWLSMRDFLKEDVGYIINCFTVKRTIYHMDLKNQLKLFFCLWGIGLLGTFFFRGSRIAVGALTAVGALFSFFLVFHIVPAQEPYKTLKNYVDVYEKTKRGDAELVLFGKRKFSVNYYTKNDFFFFDEHEENELVRFLLKKTGAFVIVKKSFLKKNKAFLKKLAEKTGRKWFVLRNDHPNFSLLYDGE